jgi:hypothetical protein
MKLGKHIIFVLLLVIVTGAVSGSTPGPVNNQSAVVTVYPNPVSNGSITVASNQRIEKIEILSILGQVVITEEIDKLTSVKLDFDLEAGIYLIKITFTDRSSDTKRIWVN